MGSSSDCAEHLVRPRLNALLEQAITKPLTIVCAGMGCGKTLAVYDFTRECKNPVLWMQFTESENIGPHFWDVFTHAVAQIKKPFSRELKKIGFPDTQDKLNIYFAIRDRMLPDIKRLYVFDDFHLITNDAVRHFLQQSFYKRQKNCSYIIISRELPRVNLSGLIFRNQIHIINEDELNFTESELNQFLLDQGLGAEVKNLSKIYADTNGYAFLINFVAGLLKKTPGYPGYVQGAIKQDISQLMEAEVWDVISARLKSLLLCLSLSDHRSTELVDILAKGDDGLISELRQQNAFIRFDSYTDSLQIHHLLLDFLRTKQDLLSDDEKRKTWKTIADWCIKNNYTADALRYYEKTGDYDSIVSVLFASPPRVLMEHGRQLMDIFNQAPKDIFDRVEFSAAMHIQIVTIMSNPQETLKLIKHYEAKYRKLPEDNAFRNRMLGCIYYNWSVLRSLLCTADDRYDFVVHFTKAYKHLKDFPIKPGCWFQHPPDLWTNLAGAARAGAPQEYLSSLIKVMEYKQKIVGGLGAGTEDLCRGELLFYQGDIAEAEKCIRKARELAEKHAQFEILCRVLFYAIRISVFQGNYQKLCDLLKDLDKLLDYNEYYVRFLTHDIVLGWYYYTLGLPEHIPDWLKQDFIFLLYHGHSLESFSNFVKAKYCYLTQNFTRLFEYIETKKQRPMVLFNRVELLAMKACAHFKMNEKDAALGTLQEAYEAAQPNGIVMPFIELGKDMQNLINAALKSPACSIPQPWLKHKKQAASAYIQNHAQIIAGYKKANEIKTEIPLSRRENAVLKDLIEGLSRTEIAAKYGLSINTIKLHINNIYGKTGACNRADLFRMAAENNLLK